MRVSLARLFFSYGTARVRNKALGRAADRGRPGQRTAAPPLPFLYSLCKEYFRLTVYTGRTWDRKAEKPDG